MANKLEKRIFELRQKIEDYRNSYYQLNKPSISDYEFDSLMSELEKLEAENPHLVTPDSPTQKVGNDVVRTSKLIKHKIPMLSIRNEKDLIKFDLTIRKLLKTKNIIEYIAELKIDGASVSMNYVNGKLKTAATRGDGTFGEDITDNIKTIGTIPKTIKNKKKIKYKLNDIEVRGEIFIYRDDFKKLNIERSNKGEEPFANPRNLSAGLIKIKDSNEVAKKPLNVFTYTLISTTENFKSQEENLSILKSLGFTVNPNFRKCLGINEVISFCSEIESVRETLPYNIDGVVVKVNSIAQQEFLGYRNDSPYWACAFKFVPPQVTTKVLGITWQVGRTGAITPVAELETKELDGSNISRATLHNFDEIQKKDIRIGDKVVIEKGGDVIPKVVEVLVLDSNQRAPKTLPPERCPACNTKLKKLKDEVAYYCKNPACPGQLINQTIHFVSKDALDIKGVGKIVAQKLIENNLINSPLNLFKLTINDFANLNLGSKTTTRLLGEKQARKIITSLNDSRSKSLNKWLFALGIQKLGKISAQLIATKHNSFNEIKHSEILRNIIKIHELLDQAEQANPRSKLNRKKSQAEILSLKNLHDQIVKEINFIGEKLVKIGWYKKQSKEAKDPSKILTPSYTLITNQGVGFESAKSVIEFFNSAKGVEYLKAIEEIGVEWENKSNKSHILEGKLFVLTGILPHLTRPEATELIQENGGRVASGFSKSADYVLVGDDAGEKLSKAKEFGMNIISEKDFISMINKAPQDSEKQKESSRSDQLDMF